VKANWQLQALQHELLRLERGLGLEDPAVFKFAALRGDRLGRDLLVSSSRTASEELMSAPRWDMRRRYAWRFLVRSSTSPRDLMRTLLLLECAVRGGGSDSTGEIGSGSTKSPLTIAAWWRLSAARPDEYAAMRWCTWSTVALRLQWLQRAMLRRK